MQHFTVAYIDTDVMFGGGVQTQAIDQSARVSVPAPDDVAGPGLFAKNTRSPGCACEAEIGVQRK